jgi:tRNA(Arg) A34 adenosine deaminase TadA
MDPTADTAPRDRVDEIVWRVPEWIAREIDIETPRRDDAARMRLAVELASRNVAHGGGPFGAVVVEEGMGRVVAVGANWVIQQRSSLLHAEVVAIAFAEASIGSYNLGEGEYVLVSSSEPCTQCLGATVWSGVRRLVCGARTADAEAIGFDEGPRRHDWVAELGARGIGVTLDVLRSEACAVLAAYGANGGAIYNGFSNGKRR